MNENLNRYRSAPWCFNGHAHTVLCSLIFRSPELPSERVIIETPDDDFLEADIVRQSDSNPVVVLFHGLEGNSKRFYITRLAEQLMEDGFNVVAVNFRSCGDKLNKQRRFYHSGETKDLHTVFNYVRNQFPNSRIFSAGFSLGASALLNYLDQYGTDHILESVAVISTPFDLKKGSLNLEKGLNRLYSRLFLQTLVEKLNQKRRIFPELPKFNGNTLYDFDDQVTAPIHGFEDADDYYYQCSSYRFMETIATPVMVIHSEQDPMCPFRWTPADQIRANPNIDAVFTKTGGHVGFWSRPEGWLNRKVADYFIRFL